MIFLHSTSDNDSTKVLKFYFLQFNIAVTSKPNKSSLTVEFNEYKRKSF
jgi:hypothetical protein